MGKMVEGIKNETPQPNCYGGVTDILIMKETRVTPHSLIYKKRLKTKGREMPYNQPKEQQMNNSIKKTFGSLYGANRWQSGAVLLLLLLAVGCSTIKYVPIKGETIVRDSIIYRERVDTVTIQLPPVKVKDYTALGDTLKLSDGYSNAWAAVDTEREMLVGGIETDNTASIDVPVKEKEKIVFKDSIRTVEIPIPVEVTKEVKVIPKFWRVTGVIGIISVLLGIVTALARLNGINLFSFFNFFKKK